MERFFSFGRRFQNAGEKLADCSTGSQIPIILEGLSEKERIQALTLYNVNKGGQHTSFLDQTLYKNNVDFLKVILEELPLYDAFTHVKDADLDTSLGKKKEMKKMLHHTKARFEYKDAECDDVIEIEGQLAQVSLAET